MLYPIIHLKGEDIEVSNYALYKSVPDNIILFVNGQHTVQGGTHQVAFREGFCQNY